MIGESVGREREEERGDGGECGQREGGGGGDGGRERSWSVYALSRYLQWCFHNVCGQKVT